MLEPADLFDPELALSNCNRVTRVTRVTYYMAY
jgi:hypothetical protein